MSRVHDWIDWIGGLPFEVATPYQILDFYRPRGFTLERLTTVIRTRLQPVRLHPPLTAPRKILFVIPGLRQGGAERQLLELMRRLPPRFAPTLCVYDGTNNHYGAELPPGEPRHVLGWSA